MTDSQTSNQWVPWCDFPNCSPSCWRRCALPRGCWDGRPANLERDAWRSGQVQIPLFEEVA